MQQPILHLVQNRVVAVVISIIIIQIEQLIHLQFVTPRTPIRSCYAHEIS